MIADDALEVQIELAVSPEDAFNGFVHGMSDWSPSAYSWSGDGLKAMVIEPEPGGACYEIGPEDFRCDWGKVFNWEPFTELGFSWQIGPDRVPVPDAAAASRVNITFAATDSGTRLTLVHEGFDQYGAPGRAYRDMMAADSGWPYMLTCFQTWCEPD